MLTALAFRHLWVKKLRTLFLLFGYALGVGVMIVLLSVGQAMLEQSRDVSLVGGGEVTVLPLGIDIEAMRTGGLGAMFFTIDRARFVGRQLLGGPRQAGMVVAVSPAIENKLVYVKVRGQMVAVRAGGDIPSRAATVGSGLRLIAGTWRDSPEDSAYVAPNPEQLYDELDHFHQPVATDSTWAEWHYFNLVAGPEEWWYLTFLVGGRVPAGPWGGRVLVTHRRPDGGRESYTIGAGPEATTFDTARADLRIGSASVHQRAGIYRLHIAQAPGQPLSLDLTVHPSAHRYFPPIVLREGARISGYVVPVLRATAVGEICLASQCTSIADAVAYHDHNWGVWKGVTWDWGSANGATFDLLYGVVRNADTLAVGESPAVFVALADSFGVRQVLRARTIRYTGSRPVPGYPALAAPTAVELVALRAQDSLRLRIRVDDVQATLEEAGGYQRYFLQMRGSFELDGRIEGAGIADSGRGFFETYLPRGTARR